MRLVVAALALAGCASAMLPGTADVRLKELVGSGAAKPADVGALLSDSAEVHVAGETVTGRDAGAAKLATLQPGGAKAELFRHHEWSWLMLSDGRGLLLQRSADDRITRAIEIPQPQPGDPVPWQAVYYARAWNEEDDTVRFQQLKPMWSETGRYVDATNDWTGPEGVSSMVGRFRKLVPGTQVKATTGIAEGGGGWMTWDWVILSSPGGRTLFFGFDIMHVGADGKVDLLVGFVNGRRAP